MFTSKIEVKNLPEVQNYFRAAKNHLINPRFELYQVEKYIKREIFPKRFNEQKKPAGGKWKPSKRVILKGGKTLTDTRALRNSMTAKSVIVGSGKLNINMYAQGEPRKYAAVHNNGMRIRNRAGRFTKMPKRQFAWLSMSEKEKIIYDIFLRQLEVA